MISLDTCFSLDKCFSKFYGNVGVITDILVSFPSHLKKLRSILRFWLEKLNCGFFHSFHLRKNTTKQLFQSKFQCRKYLFFGFFHIMYRNKCFLQWNITSQKINVEITSFPGSLGKKIVVINYIQQYKSSCFAILGYKSVRSRIYTPLAEHS